MSIDGSTTTTPGGLAARAALLDAIRGIAPELGEEELTDDARLREDLDLDSMDVLDVMTELGRLTGIEIPDADQAGLRTVADCTAYVEQRTGHR